MKQQASQLNPRIDPHRQPWHGFNPAITETDRILAALQLHPRGLPRVRTCEHLGCGLRVGMNQEFCSHHTTYGKYKARSYLS